MDNVSFKKYNMTDALNCEYMSGEVMTLFVSEQHGLFLHKLQRHSRRTGSYFVLNACTHALNLPHTTLKTPRHILEYCSHQIQNIPFKDSSFEISKCPSTIKEKSNYDKRSLITYCMRSVDSLNT